MRFSGPLVLYEYLGCAFHQVESTVFNKFSKDSMTPKRKNHCTGGLIIFDVQDLG